MTVRFDRDGILAATGGVARAVGREGQGVVSTDTRTLPPDAWFVALRGDRFDGHAFLSTAVERGALGLVVDQEIGLSGVNVVRVADTTRALQALGLASRRAFHGPVVGLTGSSGKTTTRALIALAVSPIGPVHQTAGNLNNHIGVPLTLLARPHDAAVLVVEMGTSGPGEIEVLARAAEPDVRLIVNVGPAHLEELGGLDGVAREKGALFRTAHAGHVVCVNADDPRVAAIELPPHVRRLTWGSTGDVALLEAQVDPVALATHATYRTPNGTLSTTIPAPGRHIAHNGAGALCVALALGIDLERAAEAMSRYEPVGMRLRSEPLPTGGRALNDAYNANPASTLASLELLATLPGRRAAVIGDMLELGTGEHEWHVSVAERAEALGLDAVFLVGPRMARAAHACPSAAAFEDPMDAVPAIRAWLRGAQDVVLFKGSRGARVERVLEALAGTSHQGEH